MIFKASVLLQLVPFHSLSLYRIEEGQVGEGRTLRRLETAIVFIPVLAIVGYVGWSIYQTHQEDVARNASAIAAGFTGADEMASAERIKMTDPVAFRAQMAADQAKQAADKVIRDANMRAAEAEGAVLLAERNRNPADRITMPSMTWSLGGLKNVGIVTVTINNGNDFPVKDIGIRCRFSGRSGTQLSDNVHVIFDTIPAKAKKAFKDVNMGLVDSQSAKAGCSVETASRF
jgi:hypothetical protein